MPIPHAVARFNRRVTNRATRLIAGWMPGFGIVIHIGRRSGKTYRTPVNVFRGGGGYRIALTYGADGDWVKNVRAANGCELIHLHRRIALTHPRIVSDPACRWAPPVVRQILRAIRASEYMQLARGE